LLRFIGDTEETVEEIAQWAADTARHLISKKPPGQIEVLGPAPCAMTKLKEKYRYQVMVRAEKHNDRHLLLRTLIPIVRKKASKFIQVTVDVDPYNLM
jgi:primosomal protein N' (replication factor Y)